MGKEPPVAHNSWNQMVTEELMVVAPPKIVGWTSSPVASDFGVHVRLHHIA